MFERLEVAGLQISVEGAVAAHLQGLVKLDVRIAATPRSGDPALAFHLEPIDGERALPWKVHGTVAFIPRLLINQSPAPMSTLWPLAETSMVTLSR